ncbi:MAG: homoserine O-succinyltransferase, partial [Clostridia bacterium]|nr:homoserine O-succinyltransferase [Clostridia bacterium]
TEYDADTLYNEYKRDLDAGLPIEKPVNYFPTDRVTKRPPNTWRSCANLLYSNWINYFVYQETPYDLAEIDTIAEKKNKK